MHSDRDWEWVRFFPGMIAVPLNAMVFVSARFIGRYAILFLLAYVPN